MRTVKIPQKGRTHDEPSIGLLTYGNPGVKSGVSTPLPDFRVVSSLTTAAANFRRHTPFPLQPSSAAHCEATLGGTPTGSLRGALRTTCGDRRTCPRSGTPGLARAQQQCRPEPRDPLGSRMETSRAAGGISPTSTAQAATQGQGDGAEAGIPSAWTRKRRSIDPRRNFPA